MKYRALYRETRPEVFSEILGQDSIVRILKHQVETGTWSHAYLFTGTRGTGKTTTARILAKAVNCTCEDEGGRPCGKCENCRSIAEGTFVDVIEIDAASNNGVENIRELRESVNYPPAVGRNKVYIIDEVHMLSTGAFNALLKTLEEPPENVIFILATTNPEKLPSTVLSRCMRLDFRRVSGDKLAGHMKEICEERGVTIHDDALKLLASNADGSVRDSLSILEQCLSSGEQELTRETVLDFLGAVSDEFYVKLMYHLMEGDVSSAFLMLDEALSEGKDVKQIMRDLLGHLRSLLIAKFVERPEDMLNLSDEMIADIKAQASKVDAGYIDNAIVTMAKTINDARNSTQARVLMEVALVSIAEQAGGAKEAPPVAEVSVPAADEPAEPLPEVSVPAADEPAEPLPEVNETAEPEAFNSPDGDFAGIWRDVCHEAAGIKPVIEALADLVPERPKSGELKLFTDLAMQKDIVERNRKLLQDILKKQGIEAKIVCASTADEARGAGGDADDGDSIDPELREAQKAASEFLGVDVKIE